MPTATVGILGAGPAGLSLARLLLEKGIADVTLLEASDRVGGKSLTVNVEGLGHELGTCYMTMGYDVVRRWMAQYGITTLPLAHHELIHTDGRAVEFSDFVLGESHVRSITEVARYTAEWLRFASWQADGAPEGPIQQEVGKSFEQWLDDRDLPAVKRFAQRSIVAMGYGPLSAVPALYGLRWNVPSLLLSGALARVEEPIPGWSMLWKNMASTLDVRLGHEVIGAEREDGLWVVRCANAEPMRFRQLVVAFPLDRAAGRVDMPYDLAELGKSLHWGRYASTLFEARGWFTKHDTRMWETAIPPHGRPGELLVARRTADKTPVAKARHGRRPDLYVGYQYDDPQIGDHALADRLAEGVRQEGGQITAIHRQCRWSYAPMFSGQAIQAGAVRILEGHQGAQNLWYTGATTCYESVDNIVDYNEGLARCIDKVATGQERGPSPLQRASRRFALSNK